jgi:hypothetical protein
MLWETNTTGKNNLWKKQPHEQKKTCRGGEPHVLGYIERRFCWQKFKKKNAKVSALVYLL